MYMYIIDVFVTNASLYVNQTFSYYYDIDIEKFKRVNVVFAKAKTTALVVNSYYVDSLENKENELGYKLSRIIDVIDEKPIISLRQYNLAKWLSYTTISPFISCLNTMLPKALRTRKTIKYNTTIEYIKINSIDIPLTPKQKDVLSKLSDGTKLIEARKLSNSIVNMLIEKKIISVYSEDKKYIEKDFVNNVSFKTLTKDQESVYNEVLNSNNNLSLLFGVTGSGKTEVYLHLAKKYLEEGQEVLILVPEISLTPQMTQRVKERFNDVVFYHSELSDQERYEQYQRVINKESKIVVGTRSSIFLPFNNLGLIIIDEEHDTSYKQDNTPCYNTINVAKKIAHDFNAKLVLASATPSLDSYTRALKGEYNLLKLEDRINNKLPQIKIVDLVNEVKGHNSYIISEELKKELQSTLNSSKQAIILLNRRGYSTLIKCADCGTTLMCDKCDVPLNYHKDDNVLKCHQCGRVYNIVKNCPKCNSNKLFYYGFGTKRVEEEIHTLFPNARIDRMDKDNVIKKGSYARILNKVANKETDILIGTQMIAKGLDFPDVTLVGILNGDAGLMHQDYNSAKLTFDLLMQASGRSGRADYEGKCIIQAFNPEHFVLKAVLNQSYEYFYNLEMNYRHKLNYPPYSHLIEFLLLDPNPERLNKSLNYLVDKINTLNMKMYNPVSLPKINGLNRTRVMILNKELKPMIDNVWNVVDNYLREKGLSKIKIDIDPLYLL